MRFLCALLLSVTAVVSTTYSAPLTRRARACSRVVANVTDGTFEVRRKTNDRFPYRCFRRVNAAIRNGFSETEGLGSSIEGRWKMTDLLISSATCSGANDGGEATVFFDVTLDDADTLSATVFPNNDAYAGGLIRDGFILTRQVTIRDAKFCPNGTVQATFLAEFSDIVDTSANFASFTQHNVCSDTGDTCAIRRTGTASIVE